MSDEQTVVAPDLDRLAMSDEDVRALSKDEQEARVRELVREAFALLEYGIAEHITREDKRLAGVCILYSGGNDSTTLAHLFKERADYAVHANTTIGIEQTRQFVRDTCAGWGLPLLEYRPPAGSTYRELVLDQGFPGPGHHFKMYQRLKERCLRQARRELVKHPRQERVIFLAGRRRTESARRANVPELQREGSIVWVSPLVNWTASDMSTYRRLCGDIPRNEVSDLIHMSGECLCGAFAKRGEIDELEMWFPDTVAEIRELEAEVTAQGTIPAKRCKWGWGAGTPVPDTPTGPLCTSCDARALEGQGVLWDDSVTVVRVNSGDSPRT